MFIVFFYFTIRDKNVAENICFVGELVFDGGVSYFIDL